MPEEVLVAEEALEVDLQEEVLVEVLAVDSVAADLAAEDLREDGSLKFSRIISTINTLLQFFYISI